MTFADFCRMHGLLVDGVEAGRWVRVPTEDHPRKKNGAYKWLGDVGWVQNHATMVEPAMWRDEATGQHKTASNAAIMREVKAQEERTARAWQKAAQMAHELVASAVSETHEYLELKGFHGARGLVNRDGSLIVPMRDWKTNDLRGVQVIRWLSDERRYEKKMLFGMRAKGAVFRIGSPRAARTWLVEGFATGLSVEAALATRRLSDAVLVCFSAGNIAYMAQHIKGAGFVFADNDESRTGEVVARKSGLAWCMSDVVGWDANDLHKANGVWAVASCMAGARIHEAAEMA